MQKSHPRPLKLIILWSSAAHVSANLVLNWHIWPSTWPQLNPSWCQVGMTSPILDPSSSQLRHPGATLDQGVAKRQFRCSFGSALAPHWNWFGTILPRIGEDFDINVEIIWVAFFWYLIYSSIRFPTLHTDKYTLYTEGSLANTDCETEKIGWAARLAWWLDQE